MPQVHRLLVMIVALGGCASRAGSSRSEVSACSHTPLAKVADDVACVVELRLREGSAAPIQVEITFDGDLSALRAAGLPLDSDLPDAGSVQVGLSAKQIRKLIEFEQVKAVRFPIRLHLL